MMKPTFIDMNVEATVTVEGNLLKKNENNFFYQRGIFVTLGGLCEKFLVFSGKNVLGGFTGNILKYLGFFIFILGCWWWGVFVWLTPSTLLLFTLGRWWLFQVCNQTDLCNHFLY